jgi:hypothetical protein
MGRDQEFSDNPGQLDEMRANLLDQGVTLFTVDDIFRGASGRMCTLDLVLPVEGWRAPQLLSEGAALKLVIEIKPFHGIDLFTYPPAHRARMHGPQGYTHVESYLPWLRDEFDFRCAFCLRREAWGRNADMGGFGIKRLIPASIRQDLRLVYDNLAYSCDSCLALSGSSDPRKIPTRDDIQIRADGTVAALTEDGQLTIHLMRLNRARVVEWRLLWMRIAELAFANDVDLLEKLSGWPEDLPDLRALRPPRGNLRPKGVAQSFLERRKFRFD